jgi:hypothetical protein
VILYRTAGPWGPGTGANLSAAQVDGNFFDLVGRVRSIELNPAEPVQIASFYAVGNQFYIAMSDGTVQGPVTLPTVRWFFRGNWASGVSYSRDDVVTGPDGATTYLIMWPHVSASSFDSGANDGQGHNYYSVLMKAPAAVMPAGGVPGMVLTKNSFNNFDVIWDQPLAPPGGDAGQVLKKGSDADGDTVWNFVRVDELQDVVLVPLNHGDYLRWDSTVFRWVNNPGAVLAVYRESSWAPVLGDGGAFMVLVNGTADTTVFIPPDDEQNFPIGTELTVHQDGTGKVTIVGDSSPTVPVTILKHASFSNQLLGQYATATVKKTGVNEWRLFGLLAGA